MSAKQFMRAMIGFMFSIPLFHKEPQNWRLHTDFTYVNIDNHMDTIAPYVNAFCDGKRIDRAVEANAEEGWVRSVKVGPDGMIPHDRELEFEVNTGRVQILFIDSKAMNEYMRLHGR